MSGSKLDQIVKGAPPPGTSVPAIVSSLPSSLQPSPIKQEQDAEPSALAASTTTSRPPNPTTTITPSTSSAPPQPTSTPDPLAILPSSPSQIYLNLLILEASLRSQYLHLRDRRRQNTFFLLLLSLWICFFTYLLFLRPREDGSGVGGSVYWVVETAEKVALMGGAVLAMLIWGTGQWERGIRWPRRWVGVANRGLRVVNAKIVVIKGPWWSEQLGGWLGVLFPYSAFFPPTASMWGGGYVVDGESKRDDDEEYPLRDEDLSPGGDHIKLLLLPKPFSPDFRENWELYRSEYWEKENERRARLRAALKKRQRDWAKKQRGWLWWTVWRRPSSRHGPEPGTMGKPDGEKSHHHQHHHHNQHQQQRMGEKHRRSSGTSDTHSRTSSRSSTPSSVFEQDGSRPGTKSRRGSSTTTGNPSERRRKLRVSGSSSAEKEFSKLTPISRPA